MTLTGALSAAEEAEARQRLHSLLAGLLPQPHPITALALMGEDAEGRFHLLHQAGLCGRGATARNAAPGQTARLRGPETGLSKAPGP